MATFEQMVDEVLQHLAGYGMRNDSVTYLQSAITGTALSATLGSAESLGRGLIEIDDELLYVDSFDRTTGVVSFLPFGRGFRGTTATSHAANSMVTLNPVFPRSAVARALNDTILGIGDKLFAVGSSTFTYSPAQQTYALPNAAKRILGISYQSIGPSQEWRPVRRWRLDKMANVGAFNSYKSVTLISAVEPGRTVQVFYATDPSVLELPSDDFADVTGLPESAKDVVIYGALYRLLSMVDAGLLNVRTAEVRESSQSLPYGSGSNTAKYVFALYSQRLEEEVLRLLDEYPIRPHYTN